MPSANEILPTLDQVAEYTFKSVTRTRTSQAASGKLITRSHGGQWYELTLSFPPMLKSEFGSITAFIQKQDGKNGIFYVEVPPMTDAAGFVVGNYCNYSNDTKLHMITDTGPIDVYPPARNVGGTVVTDPVYIRCSLKNDIHATRHGKDGFVRFELDLIERL